ncbi:MAG: hypothetical protein OQK04_05930, partial [Kangiellaceae bacterium]|nr:hypothetical protein [Kangiellaceae bacterium]
MDISTSIKNAFLFFLVLLPLDNIIAHPLGDMLSYKDKLLWVYVCPIKSSSHQACIMQMDTKGSVSEWRRSMHSGSDWMLSKSTDDDLYLIERYYNHSKDVHMGQLYKLAKNNQLNIIIPWYEDHHRFGESGFAVLDSGEFLFASRHRLYTRNNDGTKSSWQLYSSGTSSKKQKIRRIRLLSDGHILIIQEKD